MSKQYHKILGLVFAAAAVGVILGYGFFYFFREQSVFIIEKFKILQSLFGIQEYEEGMRLGYVFLMIFFGNLISTFGYFGLGWLKSSLPIGFITGFLLSIFLFTGIIRHSSSIPVDVYVLVSVEAIYRVMALSLGEYIAKNSVRNRLLVRMISVVICLFFLFGVFYEFSSISNFMI
jgi:hypothetical protein